MYWLWGLREGLLKQQGTNNQQEASVERGGKMLRLFCVHQFLSGASNTDTVKISNQVTY
jgi:hypothetical protein